MASAAGSEKSAVSQKAIRSDGSRSEPAPSKRACTSKLSDGGSEGSFHGFVGKW